MLEGTGQDQVTLPYASAVCGLSDGLTNGLLLIVTEIVQVAPAVVLIIIEVVEPGATGLSKASSATPTWAFGPGLGDGLIGWYFCTLAGLLLTGLLL